MCGIVGIFSFNKAQVDSETIRAMTDSIIHRGPDGEGVYLDRYVGLGHRRLSIIDLSDDGKQPMTSNDGKLSLSYNGEIYNYREIRKELKELGYSFNSKSDTEVVLYAWAEWGERCVSKFNGMFAFALWDNLSEQLFLVRDRYGIKPLYYAKWDNTLIFGSEIKAILEHPKAQRKIDKKALVEYFTFQNIFTNRTLLKDVKLLDPGSIAKVSLSTGFNIEKYWDYCFQEPESRHRDAEYGEELEFLFERAVKRQLLSDVELGSYLSGGIDSGGITAFASKENAYIKTFTCGFDLSSASGMELAFDERLIAEEMSALFKTEHYEMILKAGDMERAMSKLAWHIEEPRVGQSYPNFYAANLASKFVKVVLSGAGGDELFGGYPWRYYRAASNNNFDDYVSKYFDFWQRLIPSASMHKVFSPIWDEVKDVNTREIFTSVFDSHENSLKRPEDYINHSMYFEAKTFLHGLFVVEDKLSMAHSLETRVPFMDNDLVDFAMQCPVSLKLNNLKEVISLNENSPGIKTSVYYQRTNDGKKILRDMLSNIVLGKVSNGVKKGFSAPDASWFKGESIEYVKKMILDKKSRIYNWLDYKEVKLLVEQHFNGSCNRRLFIWSLLSFECFLIEFGVYE
jgi:asparagine synthase (glutamine-hydrolysing)